jgi:general secretion pathway protein L
MLTEISKVLIRWLDVLAALLVAWRDARRGRHAVVVAHDNGRLVIRQAEPDSVLAVLRPGAPLPAHVVAATRDGLIICELPMEEVVQRRIAVPTQAREFLPGIVRNQLERLSPWQPDEAVYGFAAAESPDDAATLDVRVLITARAVIDDACERMAAFGLPVDRIVARDGSKGEAVSLWSRAQDVSRESLERLRWQIGTGIAVTTGISLALSVSAMVAAASFGAEADASATRLAAMQRQIQGGASPQWVASLPPTQRAWYTKETSPSAVVLLEGLSRALPETAYLTELRLEGATLRITGLASDAPSLIGVLERSGRLTDVRFFAPTTRSPDGARFRFNIEAQVEPGLKVAEE